MQSLHFVSSGYDTIEIIFFDMHSPNSNYFGYLKAIVIYTLPVLLGIYYVQDKTPSFLIIRHSTRKHYKQSEILKIVIVAIEFSFIRQLVDIIFILQVYDLKFLQKNFFIFYSFSEIAIISLFLVSVGLLYQILNDLFETTLLAIAALWIINFIQYIIIKFKIGSFWIPGRNIATASNILERYQSLSSSASDVIRGILVAGSLYIICLIVFEKKDIVKNEK